MSIIKEVLCMSTVCPSLNCLNPMERFSRLLSRFQILVNLALFLSALSSYPRALRLRLGSLCPSALGQPASAVQQLQLEASSLGIGLAVHPWSLRLFSQLPFLRLTPDSALLSSSPQLSVHSQCCLFLSLQPPHPPLHRELGEMKGLLSPKAWL